MSPSLKVTLVLGAAALLALVGLRAWVLNLGKRMAPPPGPSVASTRGEIVVKIEGGPAKICVWSPQIDFLRDGYIRDVDTKLGFAVSILPNLKKIDVRVIAARVDAWGETSMELPDAPIVVTLKPGTEFVGEIQPASADPFDVTLAAAPGDKIAAALIKKLPTRITVTPDGAGRFSFRVPPAFLVGFPRLRVKSDLKPTRGGFAVPAEGPVHITLVR